ncbi:uncharacterized protein ACHE_11153S [Aspergillus chevalieri]|uniref:Galactose oxidase n=1 Tax=Aspergillus chevalieri TaxID=182096 RepID=A0A7R7ZJY2_ASPCH|nr:uncharacterized protein ACHE_11153S [Aspergillus chevalieri]BCR83751.1 hypothetical protein ACHE_11153S [Aspergillus chevalieri]
MQNHRPRMKIVSILALPFALLRLLHPVSATAIPYTPSRVFVSPSHNDSLAYILLTGGFDGQDQTRTAFLSLNISQEVDAANPSYTTLLDQAPFREDDHTTAFVPVIDDHGIIKVYTGNCQNVSDPGVVWQFTPDPDNTIGNGTWERLSVDKKHKHTYGPNYLAAGFAYEITDTTDSAVYTFGGMCPWSNETNTDWVAAADYSHDMTLLDPTTDSETSYLFESAGEHAPPIAEAGLSITPLLPAYIATADGKMLRQQDFLFIGGQTEQAFLNMSELAVYSLPHDSWNFVAIDGSPPSAKSELAVRDTKEGIIEPRSGHTAVLSPDGGKVIVVGGWVGNTSIPARPQLAILEIGSKYGGYGPWTWQVPSLEGSFLGDDSGIYGHGTEMLPGGVMMISGGYRISQMSKRSTNSQVYFYNVTSNSWATSYTNPNWLAANSVSQDPGSLSKAAKVGIGVGVPVGVIVLCLIGWMVWKYSRRFRWRRKRNSELRKLALGAQRSHFWGRDDPEMASSIHRPSLNSDRSYPWASNKGNGRSKQPEEEDAARSEMTGLLLDGLSSTKNNRQNRLSYRFSGSNPARNIHPIDEREEDEADASDNLIARDPNSTGPQMGLLGGIDIPDPHIEAPFLTPQTTHAERTQENTRAVFEENAFLARFGLDDGSTGTPASSTRDRPQSSQSNVPGTMRLGNVRRSRATLFYNPTSIPNNGQSPNTSAVASTHSKETASASSDKRYSSDSYSTAYTSQSQKQAEGEHLLREQESLVDGVAALEPEPESESVSPLELPTKVAATSSRPKGPKAAEWFGNVRRVLSGPRKWTMSDKHSSSDDKNHAAPLASGLDRRKTVLESKRVSFQEPDQEIVPPRRAVSASAELFRRKQGAEDWGVSPTSRTSHEGGKSDAMLDPTNKENFQSEEEDWDIEAAAEGRRVQVTFTVPKEQLRVVNAMPGDLESVSTTTASASRVNSGGTGTSYRTVTT